MSQSLSKTSLSFFLLIACMIVILAVISLQNIYRVSSSDSAIRIFQPAAKIDDRREIVLFRVKNTIDLQEGFKEAALNSVKLPFVFDYRLEDPQQREWFRNEVLAYGSQRIELRYNTLLEQFSLTRALASDDNSTLVETFPDLNSAMNFLLTANTYPLELGTPLSDGEVGEFLLKVRLRLDIDALPAPLQPYAYGNQGWGLDSNWVDWSVRI